MAEQQQDEFQNEVMCGGFNKGEIEEHHIELVNNLREAINQKVGKNFASLKILDVRQQVVAGINYEFLVESNCGAKVQVKVFAPLPYTNQPPVLREANLQ